MKTTATTFTAITFRVMAVILFSGSLLLASLACAKASKETIRHWTPTPTVTITPTTTASLTFTVTTSPIPVTITTTMTPPTIVQIVAEQALNIRVGPTEADQVVTTVLKGESLVITGLCRNGWAQVLWNGAPAWVNALYISGGYCR